MGYPGPPALGVGQEQTRSRGTTVARARLGTRGGGARALAPRGGGLSRVRPARERACGCACPDADWPARALRVRARCQARTVGSRSAWCLRGWCAWAADSPDWPAGGGGGVGTTLLGNLGRRAGCRGSAAPPRLRPRPPRPALRWDPEWALSRPGGRACPAGASFYGGNTHNDRKENLCCLQAAKRSRQDWASTQTGFRGGRRQKNCLSFPFLPLPLLLMQVFPF